MDSSRPFAGHGGSADAGLTTIFEGERATKLRLRKGKLVVTSGADAGREAVIDKARFSAGRSIINDLVLVDKAVSGTHFEIAADDDGYQLRDLDSSNGTFIGELRIREVYLRPGAMFRAGQTNIQFQPLQDTVDITLSEKDRFGQVIGASPIMREIFARLERVAQSDLTCLITGEPGTGKERVARGLHAASPRRDQPFVVLDCGSIPRELIESTLFDHEKGSFTGAVGQHHGCFEQADGGTILLDEIGELDISLQPRLLRVLEQREITRVGGSRPIKVDVRVVAATNRDLTKKLEEGSFREDLYYRLNVIEIHIPPMRERPGDIPLLAHHFLRKYAEANGKEIKGISEEVTFLAIWLAHTGFGLALATYLLYNYISTLPRDIFESAFIDGASPFTVFTKLVLPLSVPALASFAIFQFLWVRNDYLVALIFLGGNPEYELVTQRMAAIVGARGQDWHLLTAGAFVSMILPLVVFFSLQRYFVRGMLAGSVKG